MPATNGETVVEFKTNADDPADTVPLNVLEAVVFAASVTEIAAA